MRKRVAIMINCLKFGGAERVMADLSNYLNNNYDVYFFLMDDTDIAYDYSGKIHKISFFYKKNSPFCTLITWQHFLLTWYYKRKLKIDFTISAMEFMNFVNLMTGGKTIPTMHNYKFQHEVTPTLKDKFIEYIFSRKVKKAHKIVTVSEAILKKAASMYNIPKEKFLTVYNACDDEKIKEQMEEPVEDGISEFITPHTFVNASRLTAQKSLEKLILAFSETAKEHKLARLILIGDGEKREDLEKLCQKLKIRDKVLFTGFLKNPFSIIAKARAFVLSSHYEGFGNVIIEAMCCGTAVISVDCSAGPREIIAPGTTGVAKAVELCEFGILTPAHDGSDDFFGVKEISQAMKMLIEDNNLVDKYRNKSLIRYKDFSVNKSYSKWDSVLR